MFDLDKTSTSKTVTLLQKSTHSMENRIKTHGHILQSLNAIFVLAIYTTIHPWKLIILISEKPQLILPICTTNFK